MTPSPSLPLPAAFKRLAWSNLAAQSAEQIALAAAPMVAVLALGAGVAQTGLLSAAQTLPFLLLSVPVGVLADRLPRRVLMSAAEGLRAAALIALPVLAAAGALSVPLLAVLGFLAATGTVVFSVAAPATVPALVPRESLALANSRLELARSVAFAAGPALAGALVAWTGASPAFVFAATLSAVAAVLLAGMPQAPQPPQPSRNFMRELREGAQFAWGETYLRPIMLTAVAWNLSWFVLQAAYVPYAVQVLGLSASGVGITLAAFGAGMVVGALLAPRLMRAIRIGTAIVIGPVVSVGAAAVMAASIVWPAPVLPAAAFFLFGAGPIVWTISQSTLRQVVTPKALLGRVSALFMMAQSGARPIGALLGALVGGAYGPASCILLAALGFGVQALIILASPVPRLEDLPEAAAVSQPGRPAAA